MRFAFSFTWSAHQVLDNADGKQARKTGNSSTLGMLFDHGCDTINTVTLGISLLHILGLNGFQYHFCVCLLALGFYISTLVQLNHQTLHWLIVSAVHQRSQRGSTTHNVPVGYFRNQWKQSVGRVFWNTWTSEENGCCLLGVSCVCTEHLQRVSLKDWLTS